MFSFILFFKNLGDGKGGKNTSCKGQTCMKKSTQKPIHNNLKKIGNECVLNLIYNFSSSFFSLKHRLQSQHIQIESITVPYNRFSLKNIFAIT